MIRICIGLKGFRQFRQTRGFRCLGCFVCRGRFKSVVAGIRGGGVNVDSKLKMLDGYRCCGDAKRDGDGAS